MKIIVAVNTLTSVAQPVYSNHCQFWYRLGKHFPDINFILNNPRRLSIDAMRNMTAKVALENDCSHILFIDDDVLIPFDTLGRLLHSGADISAGWTLIRGYPYKNMFFKYIDEDKTMLKSWQEPVENEQGLYDVDAVGFSCCLINMDLVRKMSQPYFVTGPFNTEDIYFCLKAKKEFPETRIVVDPKVITSHILGVECIDPTNKEAYMEYHEKLFPEDKNLVDLPEKNPIQRIVTTEENKSYEDLLVDSFGTKK